MTRLCLLVWPVPHPLRPSCIRPFRVLYVLQCVPRLIRVTRSREHARPDQTRPDQARTWPGRLAVYPKVVFLGDFVGKGGREGGRGGSGQTQ